MMLMLKEPMQLYIFFNLACPSKATSCFDSSGTAKVLECDAGYKANVDETDSAKSSTACYCKLTFLYHGVKGVIHVIILNEHVYYSLPCGIMY